MSRACQSQREYPAPSSGRASPPLCRLVRPMPSITLTHERLDLPFKTPWTISRGTRRSAENVLVRLIWQAPDGRHLEGLGEAAPYAFYGELRGTVEACLDEFAPLLG